MLAFESLPGTVRARRRRLRSLGGAEVYAERDAGERTAEAAGLLAGANGVPCAPEVLLRLPLANNILRLVLRDAQTSHGTEPLASRSSTSRWEIRLALPTELEEEDEVEEISPKRRRTGGKKSWQSSAVTSPCRMDMGSMWDVCGVRTNPCDLNIDVEIR